MMNKKLRQTGLLVMSMGLLSGCIKNIGPEKEEEIAPDKATVNTTKNQLSKDLYRGVIVDAKYDLGASASGDNELSASGNAKAFEEGLLNISKGVFPPDQYYLSEGKLIDDETLTNWLSRESEKNPEGLNPALEAGEEQASTQEAENSETTENTQDTQENDQVVVDTQATPIYLSQIEEKNIMVETKEGFALNGIVLGLAMNSKYSYTDKDGVVHEQEISTGELRERGKQYANIIVGRLRNTEELRSVPIVVGIYRISSDDEAVGGTYVMDGVSREGNSVSDWKEHNEYRVMLPIMNQNLQSEQYVFFDEFRNKVLDFFPNLNGITGEALYVNDQLDSLNIEVFTQFYSKTEITALTQYLTDVAQTHLPEKSDIEIRVESIQGTEAYVGRQAGQESFQSHVFY